MEEAAVGGEFQTGLRSAESGEGRIIDLGFFFFFSIKNLGNATCPPRNVSEPIETLTVSDLWETFRRSFRGVSGFLKI